MWIPPDATVDKLNADVSLHFCNNYIILLFLGKFFLQQQWRLKDSLEGAAQVQPPQMFQNLFLNVTLTRPDYSYLLTLLLQHSDNNLLNFHFWCLEFLNSVCLIWYKRA